MKRLAKLEFNLIIDVDKDDLPEDVIRTIVDDLIEAAHDNVEQNNLISIEPLRFTVQRNGQVIECNVEADSEEEAINKAKDNYSYEHYGQGGALTKLDIADEEWWLNADFSAEMQKGEI